MESVWFKPDISDEIIKNNGIFEQTRNIIADILSKKIDITQIVENMSVVLTSNEPENRKLGMSFFTKLLTELPKDYLTWMQIKFISKFYVDRLKDHHQVIPTVLSGYIAIIEMKNYDVSCGAEFFNMLFREISCQSQTREDRLKIYLIVHKLMERDIECMKTMSTDFVYNFILAIDGEKDPRNLLFLFSFLPKFIAEMPLGNMIGEAFDAVSCYFPIDYHPSPGDPAPITREDLANALLPCLCASPKVADLCILLVLEKLESTLKVAKLDSLKLLKEGCNVFPAEEYNPFLKKLWSLIYIEITNKMHEDVRLAAHEALSALIAKLATKANTNLEFENFINAIIITTQTTISEATTVTQFVQATKLLLTAANASKESCFIITKTVIPALINYYEFAKTPKLQIASLYFMGDLHDLAKNWQIIHELRMVLVEIPHKCLTAVSQPIRDFQIAGFKTLVKVIDVLQEDLILPYVEILTHIVHYSHDNELLTVTIEAVHAIARKYPELIMNLLIKEKWNLENLICDKTSLNNRLNLLVNLASIDDFTKVIIDEMLKVVIDNEEHAPKVVESLSNCMSNNEMFTDKKLIQIESDHGLIDTTIAWLLKETYSEHLEHGYDLIVNTMTSLPDNKQKNILDKHTANLLEKCKVDESYFPILESLYRALRRSVVPSHLEDILSISLTLAVSSERELMRRKSGGLAAHFLNKSERGRDFELLYDLLKRFLSSCSKDEQSICPKILDLYAWLCKGLVMRGSDLFFFWLSKIMVALSSAEYCNHAVKAIRLIMADDPEYLTAKCHCKTSLLYKQRMFKTFADKLEPPTSDTNEAYLLAWAYILGKTPKVVLNTGVSMVLPLIIDSLQYDNRELLTVMTDVLCHYVQAKHALVADSLQTILPRLVTLSRYVKSMDVRIKTLQCLYEIANTYPTMLLLPYKQDMIFDLAPSLDDSKRLVRNMAVKARTRWFLIGSPGESK